MVWARACVIAALVTCAAACSSITTTRVQPESVAAGPHLRPIAIVHAQVTSAYVLFFAIPGHISLDYVVNRMLIHAAKELGADKVVDIKVDITPGDGIWTFRKLLGWRSAEASGVAVVIEDEPPPPPAVPAPAAPAPQPTPSAGK